MRHSEGGGDWFGEPKSGGAKGTEAGEGEPCKPEPGGRGLRKGGRGIVEGRGEGRTSPLGEW